MAYPQAISNLNYSFELPGFDSIPALKNVSINDIRPGQMIFVVGPNGSGKSTLLNCVTGKLPGTKPIKYRFSYIPQDPSNGIIPELSVIENIIIRRIIKEGSSLKNAISKSVHQEVLDICTQLQLDDFAQRLNHPPSALSGGQKQLLNILSAMISEPEIIILDEPTSKLDEINKIKVLNVLIEASHRTNAPIICTTHDLHYVERIADRIISLRDGEIANDQIIREPLTKRFVGAIRFISQKKNLPKEFSELKETWWQSNENNLFPKDYLEGDDSVIGYLAQHSMNRNERTNREVNGLINILSLSQGGNINILDIPCGWGRHTLELSKRGFKVTGIDLCREYLDIGIKSASEQKLNGINFTLGDMRNIPCESNSFDVILNLWTSFGFFSIEDDNLKVLSEFTRLLKPGGRVLLHSDHNAYRISHGIFDEPDERKLFSGGILRVTEYFCAEDNAVYGIWHVLNSTSSTGNRKNLYRIKIYSELDWKSIPSRVGLQLESILGGFDKSSLNLTQLSQEQIVVLKKPN